MKLRLLFFVPLFFLLTINMDAQIKLHSSGGISIGSDKDPGVDNISLDKEAVFTSDMGQIPRFAGGLKTSVIYYTGSDIRLNENVIKIKDKGSAVEKLSALEGIEYSFKEDKEKRRMLGFSAQELQSVIPELVLKDENDMLAVDYTGMIPYLVEAIKEQQARINELEKMLIEMEN